MSLKVRRIIGIILIVLLFHFSLAYCSDEYIQLNYRIENRIKAYIAYCFSKTYSSPKDAMKADDYCVGAVGSVYYLIYNDYMDALVVPTGESWKRIEMAEFTRVYKGVNYDMGGDATLIIRQIGSKWYAYFISVEPIDDVIVSTNGKRMEQDIIIWKYYVYKGLLFLGSETDSIEINWYSTQISYDKSKWKINEAGLS